MRSVLYEYIQIVDEQSKAPYGPWSITEELYAKYKLLFEKGAEGGRIDRSIAMSMFQQSKQPQDTIDEVYGLIDRMLFLGFE